MFDGFITEMGYVISAAFGITLLCGGLMVAARRWGPQKIRIRLNAFPMGWALVVLFPLVILVGCVWALSPVDQPASLRMVRAIEVPIRSYSDREDLKKIMWRHGERNGLHFVDTSESWRTAPPDVQKTLYFALDRPVKDQEEWEVIASDDGSGTYPWVVFFYGVDPASAKASRDPLISTLRERFTDSVEVPIMPNGNLPLRGDLVRTPAGYEIRPDRAADYSMHPESKTIPAPIH